MTRRNCPGITRGHIDLRQQGFRATERDDVDERCRECRESIPEHVSSRCVAERHMPTKERRSGAFMNISLMVPAQLRQDIGRHADHEIDVTGHQILRRRGATTVRYESKCRMHRRIPNEQCCFLCNAGMRWVLGALRSRPRVAWQSARRGLRRRDQVGLFLGMSSGRPLGRIGHDLVIQLLPSGSRPGQPPTVHRCDAGVRCSGNQRFETAHWSSCGPCMGAGTFFMAYIFGHILLISP
jgi:hypothetical protein